MLEALPVCKADKGRYDFPMIILPQGEGGGEQIRQLQFWPCQVSRQHIFLPCHSDFIFSAV